MLKHRPPSQLSERSRDARVDAQDAVDTSFMRHDQFYTDAELFRRSIWEAQALLAGFEAGGATVRGLTERIRGQSGRRSGRSTLFGHLAFAPGMALLPRLEAHGNECARPSVSPQLFRSWFMAQDVGLWLNPMAALHPPGELPLRLRTTGLEKRCRSSERQLWAQVGH